MKIKEVPRTATFTWTNSPLANTLITGTASGAIDADFNSNTQLEIWKTDRVEPVFSTEVDARFHDIAVSPNNKFVAGAAESGVVNLWKLENDSLSAAGSGTNHDGAARAVAFNAENKLVSAGNNGQLFTWDLTTMQGAAPGVSSRKDDIVGVAWNKCVNQILATAGNGGFTSIWDLRKKKEVIHLHHAVAGSRLPTSSVSWHASNSTKLVTASSDDQNPVVLVWDLRNANSPETILEGHSAGVLSVDWCSHDPSLLLSSGKDNRTLLWNPEKKQLLGEYPISVGWTFKTQFNPRVPDIFASASFDGKVTVQTLQDTSEPTSAPTAKASGDAFWDSEEVVDAVHPQFHAHQAPAWLKRPVSVSFGFGGKLVTSIGSNVKISTVKASATDVSSLKTAFQSQKFDALVDRDGSEQDTADWKLLKQVADGKPLFEDEPQDETKDDDFVVHQSYNPTGEYKLLDGKNDKITKLVLAGKTAAAVDALIDNGAHGDALLLASYDPELLTKARDAYLVASDKPYLRAAWASKNNQADFANVELDAWTPVLRIVHSDPSKTAVLGERLAKAGRRDDALRTFLSGGNIASAGEIWLKELPGIEKRYLSDKKHTAYQARAKALQEVVEKVTVASKGRALPQAESKLYDAYRDFADIVASQGDLELAFSLLSLLPGSYSQEKDRVSGASAKKQAAVNSRAKKNTAAASSFVPAAAPTFGGPSAAAPAAAPSPIGRAPPTPVSKQAAPSPYVPSAAPKVSNPYAAPAAPGAAPASPYGAPANPYAAAAGVPSPYGAAGPYGHTGAAAAPPAPPKSGKVSTTIKPPSHGWNDLPETSIQSKSRRPAAPAVIPNQHANYAAAHAPPPRAPSTGPTPPPKTGGPRPAGAAASPVPSKPSTPAPSNPYAPPPGAAKSVPSPYAPQPGAASSVAPPAPNPYAPSPRSAPSPAAAAPPVSAPKPAAAPPPPRGKARSANPPLAAAVAASLPVTDTANGSSSAAKHPDGDRSHIPAEAKPIYETLSESIELVRPTISAQFPKQMKDTEARLNILFNHLNNQDLIGPDATAKLVDMSAALKRKDFDAASRIQHDVATTHSDECGKWMTGLSRLIQMLAALPQ